MQDFCTSEVQKYGEVRRSTEKYREVPRNTEKYEEVQRSSEKYREVRRSTKKYREVQKQYREVPRSLLSLSLVCSIYLTYILKFYLVITIKD
jgi:cell fate (sporulation/competence/biofilm development) regulator YlbF (YheA/YmcA/DUF963 family)